MTHVDSGGINYFRAMKAWPDTSGYFLLVLNGKPLEVAVTLQHYQVRPSEPADPVGLASALARIEQSQGSWLSILLPGWGNPEPSWLRSHPATVERIKRLKTYALQNPSQRWLSAGDESLNYIVNAYSRAPRWRIGGLWR